jgi:hypothetical protein
MKPLLRCLFAVLLFAGAGFAQTIVWPVPVNSNPQGQYCSNQQAAETFNGKLYVCTGPNQSGIWTFQPAVNGWPVLSCAGNPGATVAVYRQQCQTAGGQVYSCNNTAGCALSTDWTQTAVIACAASPGNTIAPPNQLCSNSAGVVWICTAPNGCVTAGDWIAVTGSGGGTIYPAAGVPYSTGATWGTSYTVGMAANNLVQLNGAGQLPAVSAALLTNFPTFNQSTTGNAATATAFAALPTPCLAGLSSASGILANGNATGCALRVINVVNDFGAVADGVTDNTAALASLNSFLQNHDGSIVYFPPGTYVFTNNNWMSGVTNLTVFAYGAYWKNTWNADDYTIHLLSLYFNEPFGTYSILSTYTGQYLINSVNAFSQTVTTTTASQAGNFNVGDDVLIAGYLQQNGGYPPNLRYFDYGQVTAVNASTGVISLAEPLENSYNSAWYPDPTFAGAGVTVGPAIIMDLTRPTDPTWPMKLAHNITIYGATTLPNPNCPGGGSVCNVNGFGEVLANGSLNFRFVDCHFGNVDVSESKSVSFEGGTMETIDMDKLVNSVSINNVKISTLSTVNNGNGTLIGGSGTNNVYVSNSTISGAVEITPRYLTLVGNFIQRNYTGYTGLVNVGFGNGGGYDPPTAVVNMIGNHLSQYPGSANLSVLFAGVSGGQSLTALTAPTSSSITIALSYNQMTSLDVGTLMQTAGGAKAAIVSSIVYNGTNLTVNGTWIVGTPAASDVYTYNNVRTVNISGNGWANQSPLQNYGDGYSWETITADEINPGVLTLPYGGAATPVAGIGYYGNAEVPFAMRQNGTPGYDPAFYYRPVAEGGATGLTVPYLYSSGGANVTSTLVVGNASSNAEINLSGYQLINATGASLPAKQSGTILQIGNVSGASSRVENDCWAASCFFTAIRTDGTIASPTGLLLGDQIGGYNSFGYDGTAVVGPAASLRTYASANWTHGSATGTYVDITTTPSASTTAAEVIRFENDGGITIPSTVTGGDTGPGTINASGGFYIRGVSIYPALCTGQQASQGISAGSSNCFTPAGGGNVSTGGTPTANTLAMWTASTVIGNSSISDNLSTTVSTPETIASGNSSTPGEFDVLGAGGAKVLSVRSAVGGTSTGAIYFGTAAASPSTTNYGISSGGSGIDINAATTGNGIVFHYGVTPYYIWDATSVTTFAGVTTAGYGVTLHPFANVPLTGLTAPISTTSLGTTGATGLYRVCYTAKVTTAAGSGSALGAGTTNGFIISYTDGGDSTSQTTTVPSFDQTGAAIVPATGNTALSTAASAQGCGTVYAMAGTAISYAFGYTAGSGPAMAYELHATVELSN